MVTIELTTVYRSSGGMEAQLSFKKKDGSYYCRSYSREHLKADSSQRQELKAVAAGLSAINCPAHVICNVHQSHVKAAINQGWWKLWKNCGWKNQKGRLVRDWELWREIAELAEKKSLIISGGKDEFDRTTI